MLRKQKQKNLEVKVIPMEMKSIRKLNGSDWYVTKALKGENPIKSSFLRRIYRKMKLGIVIRRA